LENRGFGTIPNPGSINCQSDGDNMHVNRSRRSLSARQTHDKCGEIEGSMKEVIRILSFLALIAGIVILAICFVKRKHPDRFELWLGRCMGFFAMLVGVTGVFPPHRLLSQARNLLIGMFFGVLISAWLNSAFRRPRNQENQQSDVPAPRDE
jgi:hypothetical protein